MTDEPFSPSPSAPPPPTEADYEAIAAAVMGTVRGRWFLAEFAKRNRNADSALILERFDRIEKLLQAPPAVSPAERLRVDLVEMAKAIARTRSEIAAIRLDGDAKGTLSEASEELDSIVQTTERATSDILAAAEQIQEIGWTLRERGADGAICDSLDQRATDIYSACSFQDLTGQRTRKVVEVLQFLEDRIRAMIEIWGGAVQAEDGAPAAAAAPHVGEDRTVPHLEQQDIDRMMPAARPAEAKQNGHDVAAADHARGTRHWPQPAAAEHSGVVAGSAASAAPAPAGGPQAAMAVATAAPGEAMAAADMTPALAVVGATALALDPAPVATTRLPEHAPAPQDEAELQVQAELQIQAEPQARAEPQAEAELEAEAEPEPEPQSQPEVTAEVSALAAEAPHPAPQPELIPETSEIEADAEPSEPRSDPAAVLKRILAIIRAPSEPVTWGQDTSTPLVAADQSAEPVAAPEAEAAAMAAAVSILAPAAAAIVAAGGSGPDMPAVGVAAAEHMAADGGAIPEPDEVRPPRADDAADDVRMPLSGPLTVDQAVDAMLKARAGIDVAATRARTDLAAPAEDPAAGEPPAGAAEPAAGETEPIAAAASRPRFVIEAPAFTVAASTPASPAEPEPEPALVAETVAPAIAEPAASEPQAVSAALGASTDAEATAPACARTDEPPVESVAELAPIVTPAPSDVAAPEPPPPVALPAVPSEPARPEPRHPGLAAITALSDEEKIALFS